MLYDIKVYRSPNFESRNGFKPIMIVNHITDGEKAVRRNDEHENSAVYNTFMNPACEASSHYVIQRDGTIIQYVDVRNAAWTQGLHSASDFAKSTSPIVRQMKVNPNLYCISKEFIGYAGAGGDGSITEAQFRAGVWLDKFIQREVQTFWGHVIPLNSTYEIGHFQVDPVYKPSCPGRNFPWQRVYQELAVADSMSFEDYEGRLTYLKSDKAKLKKAVDVWNEVDYLKDCADGEYGEGVKQWALTVFRGLYIAFDSLGVLKDVYSDTDDYIKFHGHIVYLYNCAMGKDKPENVGWGIAMMEKAHPYMLQNGLVPAA